MQAEEFKVGLFGDGGVGKTSTCLQFYENIFQDEIDPTIEFNFRKQMLVDDLICILQADDVLYPCDFYHAFRERHITDLNGFILMYSITCKRSFDAISDYYHTIKQVKDSNNFPTILLGNKCDYETMRQVSVEEGEELARLLNCPFYEISAKYRINIVESFTDIVREIRILFGSTPLEK